MKKVTLFAAILALAIMGCSDAGMDNSIASTSNDVKNEQTLAAVNEQNEPSVSSVLEKVTWSEPSFDIQYFGYENFNGVNFAIHGYSWVEESPEKRGIGYFDVNISNTSAGNRKLDVVHAITLNVADCKYKNGQAQCRYVDWRVDHWYNVQSGQQLINQTSDALNFIDRDRITTISMFAGVWHMGRNDEVILQGSTYDGYLHDTHNQQLALLVAQRYLQMAADANN